MSTKPTYDDANLILRLYDMRREERLREARDWFVRKFIAKNMQEVSELTPPGAPESASLRMVASYWDMAASFVNSGVLNPELFFKSGNEIVFVYLRLSRVLEAIREQYQDPSYFAEGEQVALAMIEWKKSHAPGWYEAFSKRVLAT
jgi:hypothetical protein